MSVWQMILYVILGAVFGIPCIIIACALAVVLFFIAIIFWPTLVGVGLFVNNYMVWWVYAICGAVQTIWLLAIFTGPNKSSNDY